MKRLRIVRTKTISNTFTTGVIIAIYIASVSAIAIIFFCRDCHQYDRKCIIGVLVI